MSGKSLEDYFGSDPNFTGGMESAAYVRRIRGGGEQLPEFTAAERERVIASVIASQALAGITVPREVAEAAFDAALREPLPQIGEEEVTDASATSTATTGRQ